MDTYRFRKHIHRLPGKVIHAIPLPEPEVTTGQGARREIGAMCRKAGYKRVLVVTDETLHRLGYDEAILASLKDSGVSASLFCDIHSEPTIAIIDAGRKQALETQAEAYHSAGWRVRHGQLQDDCRGLQDAPRAGESAAAQVLARTRRDATAHHGTLYRRNRC